MIKGDWVVDTDALKWNQYIWHLGKVTEVYEQDGEQLFNAVMYVPSGTKVGRVSDDEGGPKNFEPALRSANYTIIDAPEFPLPNPCLRDYMNFQYVLDSVYTMLYIERWLSSKWKSVGDRCDWGEVEQLYFREDMNGETIVARYTPTQLVIKAIEEGLDLSQINVFEPLDI